jgi:electron transfer flavoprotein beta subunit
MKCVIAFKWAKNPQDARVSADGAVDWRAAKMVATDDDAAAVVVARDLAAGDELVGLTVGDGDVAWAAARGASSTMSVADVEPNADSAVLGEVLAAGVRRIGGADIVIIGDGVWDQMVAMSLAGQLGWAALAGVVSATAEGDRLHVTRKSGTGTEVIEVGTPVVLAVAARRAEDKPPGMKDVLTARKKPLEKVTMADLGVTSVGGVTVRGTALPEAADARIFDGADPEGAVEQLMTALRSEGVL